jgi:NTE family protein
MIRLCRRKFVCLTALLGVAPLVAFLPGRVKSRPGQPPAVAVCLGSGALHGYAHIGAIKAFEQFQFRPDVITGTSAGAIVGALWAAGYKANEIKQIAEDSSWREASGLRIPKLGIGRLDGLRALIDRHIDQQNIESLPTRFAAVATDLDSGLPVILDHGPVGEAVAASASVPIRYEPILFDGKRLIDGALSGPIPVDAARNIGAKFTIAIDVAYRPYEEPVSGITDVAFQMFHIMVNRLIEEQIKRADFAIRLDLHRIMKGEDAIPAMIRAGERTVRKHWPALSRALQSAGIAVS